MEEFLEGLRNFVCDDPDPSEFIGVPHNRTGIKHTDETKELCRQKSLGRRHTKETCNKMSKSRIGHPVNEETRNKIANTLCKGPYLMKHISGKEVLVYNITKWCRDNNFHHGRVMDRVTGRVTKLYRGWTGQPAKSVV